MPGLRVVIAVGWLASLAAMVLLAVRHGVPGRVMVAFLAPQLPVAYLAAYTGVARARRGQVPDWRELIVRQRPNTEVPPRRVGHSSSPICAQTWFEWRQHGWSLPAWVAILLAFEMTSVWVASTEAPALVLYTLLIMLLSPPVMAAFAAVTVRNTESHVRDPYSVTPFIATRPLTSVELVRAKLTMTVRTTLAAWLLIAVALPIALTLSDTWPVMVKLYQPAVLW